MEQTSAEASPLSNYLERNDDDTLLSQKQVKRMAGNVSDMCLWRWQRDDRVRFPKPLKINGRNYWRRASMRSWLAERSEQKAA